MKLSERLVGGAIAGAVGTLALDVMTYGDMLLRGRPASELPAQASAQLAERVGVDLTGDDEPTKNRRSALGSVLGYATGVSVGVAWTLLRGERARRGGIGEAVAVSALAMTAANGPMIAQGLTDPRTWGAAGWISDIVPHLAYGAGVVAALRRV